MSAENLEKFYLETLDSFVIGHLVYLILDRPDPLPTMRMRGATRSHLKDESNFENGPPNRTPPG